MARPDFYKVLSVSSSASQDEIKSAHRELVKIFHPDLFYTSAEKARANKRLQQINEAYATLSNSGRRRQYDATQVKSASAANGASAAATKRSSSSTTRHSPSAVARTELLHGLGRKLGRLRDDYRSLAAAERRARRDGKPLRQSSSVSHGSWDASRWTQRLGNLSGRWRRWAKHEKNPGFRKPMTIIASAIILLIFALILSAVLEEPQTARAWGLLENTVMEPGHDSLHERQWISLGHYNTTSECAESLRKQAALDAQRGGKVFLDERNSTIAMTIYAKSEGILAEEYFRVKLQERPTADRQLLEQEAREEAREFIRRNGIAQRVKHYQCREVQLLKPQSWLRTKLTQLGLIN
jgi:curved DNA-binding protein CbpA